MYLRDLTEIKIRFVEADFWIIRRGSIETVGSVTMIYNPEHIGVKVIRVDLLNWKYLYYALMDQHSQGRFRLIAHGSLALVNIRTEDIRKIKLG